MTHDKHAKVDEVDSEATIDDVLSDAIVVENSGHVGELSGLVTQENKRENQKNTDDKPSSSKKVDESTNKDKVLYSALDFRKGTIVWAKRTDQFPAWLAIVIDPKQEAPEAVMNVRVP